MQPVQRICDFVEVDTPDLAGDPRFFTEMHLKKQLPPPPPLSAGWVGGWVGWRARYLVSTTTPTLMPDYLIYI